MQEREEKSTGVFRLDVGHTLSRADLDWLVSLTVTVIFVALQLASSIRLVIDFDWIYFVDQDDAYNVEQFLSMEGGDAVPGLGKPRISYGSELFLLLPLYRFATLFSGAGEPLSAYRFLKLLHILSGGFALLVLWLVFRRVGAPKFVAPLAIALIATHPLFFTNALILKPDANIVLLLLIVSFWGLFRYDDNREMRWLIISVASAALGTAIKWWGLFMLLPQLLLLIAAQRSAMSFKPVLNFRGLAVANGITGVVLATAVVVQSRLLLRRFSVEKAFVLGAGAMVLVCVAVLLVLICSRHVCRHLESPAAAFRRSDSLYRSCYWVLAISSLFGSFYVVFVAPFLLSDQLQPSVWYFSKYLLVSPTHVGAYAVGGSLANLVGWMRSIHETGTLPLFLIPVFVGSAILLVRGLSPPYVQRRLCGVAVFGGGLLLFLATLVSKKNFATLAMFLPFVLLFALVPITVWTTTLPAPKRMVVVGALLALCGGQLAMQGRQLLDVLASYPRTIQAITTVNDDLAARMAKIEGFTQPQVLLLRREFPIESQMFKGRHLTEQEYEAELLQWGRNCHSQQTRNSIGNADRSSIVMVFLEPVSEAFRSRLNSLLSDGCVERIAELAVGSYMRGDPVQRRYVVYTAAAVPTRDRQ